MKEFSISIAQKMYNSIVDNVALIKYDKKNKKIDKIEEINIIKTDILELKNKINKYKNKNEITLNENKKFEKIENWLDKLNSYLEKTINTTHQIGTKFLKTESLLIESPSLNKSIETEFIKAIMCGNKEVVVKLLKQKEDLINIKQNGRSALHFAALYDHIEICNLLVDHGAKINEKDNKNQTPLEYYWRHGEQNFDTIALLVSKGAEYEDENGWTFLDVLLDKPLAKKSFDICVRLFEREVERGFDIKKRKEDTHLLNLLRGSVMFGNLDLCKRLIDEGIAFEDKYAHPPLLHFALLHKNSEIAKLLINKGSDNKILEKALILAAENGNLEVCKLLIKKTVYHDVGGGNLIKSKAIYVDHCRDMVRKWNTPLHIASAKGHSEICEFFIKKSATDLVNKANKKGQTPLHLAKNSEILKILINNKGDVNATDKTGQTPLHMAARRGDLESCRLLVSIGADVKAVDSDKQSILLRAVGSGNLELCRFLVENGVDDIESLLAGTFKAMEHPKIWTFLIEQAEKKAGKSVCEFASSFFLLYAKQARLKQQSEVKEIINPSWITNLSKQFSKEYLTRKFITHAFEWKGLTPITLKSIPGSVDIKCEGSWPEGNLKEFSKSLISFSQEFPNLVSSEKANEISRICLDSANHKKQSAEEKLFLWKKGGKLALNTGYRKHAATIAFDGNRVILCDRASRSKKGNFQAYTFDESTLTKEVIEKIENLIEKSEEKYHHFIKFELSKLLKFSNLEKIESLSSIEIDPQEVGNCSWANTEGPILLWLILIECEKQGINLKDKEGVKKIEIEQRKVFENWRFYQKQILAKRYLEMSKKSTNMFVPDYSLLLGTTSGSDLEETNKILYPSTSDPQIEKKLISNWGSLSLDIEIFAVSEFTKSFFQKLWPF